MSEDCIFCKIADNKSPASFVYKDEQVIAFMDNKPVSEGHTLVIPRKHYENIYTTPDEDVAYLFKIVKKVALAVKTAIKADGIRLVQSNGGAAGQVVFHIHVHIIPAYEGQQTRQRRVYGNEELDKTAAKIRLCM
jgi:histidine triad (HIT) family protein